MRAGVHGFVDGGTTGTTTDGGVVTGCGASPAFMSCEVMPNGSQKCTNLCSSTEYSLAEFGCRVLPLPTPLGVTNYCCPCSS